MNKTRLFLILQSILYILLAILMISTVISIYHAGAAARADNPVAWIFTREIGAAHFLPIAPLLFAAIAMSVVGIILHVKDENGLKPVKGEKVVNIAPDMNTVRIVLLAAAVVLSAAGIYNGSAGDVFGKAVKICTECVGLG